MSRIVSALSLLLGVFASCAAFAADPLVVDLWPGKTPGDVGIDGQESSRQYESPLLDRPTRLITNVTRPTLTVYLPPREKNTGTAMLICPGGGYHNLFWELEGEEVAAWLTEHGIAGIILKYRCPRRPGDVKGEPPLGPQLDAQRAVSLVRRRAKVPCELHVFASGEHDFGVRRNDKLPASWTGLCLKWLKSRGLWAAK